jgi:hypothetical protein
MGIGSFVLNKYSLSLNITIHRIFYACDNSDSTFNLQSLIWIPDRHLLICQIKYVFLLPVIKSECNNYEKVNSTDN